MSDKIIINNRTKATMQQCCDMVKKVIGIGRISNKGKEYGYMTTFSVDDITGKNRFHVITEKNKKSDTFIIVMDNSIEDEICRNCQYFSEIVDCGKGEHDFPDCYLPLPRKKEVKE